MSQVSQLSSRVGVLQIKVDGFNKLLDAVEEVNPNRPAAIVKVWRQRGGDVGALTRLVQLSGQRQFTPGSFTRRELDLGLLDLILGNLTLVYAHNHALGLPSITTIRNHGIMTKITPNIGPLSLDVVKRNLEQVFLKALDDSDITDQPLPHNSRTPSSSLRHPRPADLPHSTSPISPSTPPRRRLANFQADGIKTTSKLEYHYATDSLITSCFIHTKTAEELRMDTEEKVKAIREKLDAGELHAGTEMTVIAVKVFGLRGVSPILLASGCSVLDAPATSNMIQTVFRGCQEVPRVLDVILPNAWVCDGAAQWRLAGFMECMKYRISPTFQPKLHVSTSRMHGFNPFTGPDGITQEFDYRHLWKRALVLGCVCTIFNMLTKPVMTIQVSADSSVPWSALLSPTTLCLTL